MTAVMATVLTVGATAISKWPHAWTWLTVVTAVLAALAVPLSTMWADSRQRQADAARTVRGAVQDSYGSRGNQLPVVGDVDLQARVHTAVIEMPYIRRDAEQQLRAALAAGRPALLIGSSMVGKTRMAAEVVEDMFPGRPVIAPDDRAALHRLDAADLTPNRAVVWLDDLDRLIGTEGITDGALRRLAANDNTIIATIRAQLYDNYLPTHEIRPPEWDIITVFDRVILDRRLTRTEEQRLHDAVADPNIRERVQAVGLGEYVGAAEHITDQLRLGPTTNPVGHALVRGAADWHRTGTTAAVPAGLLPDLAAPHLDVRGLDALAKPDAYATALEWATRRINPTVSLLIPADRDTYTVYDYALDHLSRDTPTVPDTTWQLAIRHTPPTDLLFLGYQAWAGHRRPDVARKAWMLAANNGSMAALNNLGTMLAEQGGDPDEAERYIRLAADSGLPDAMSNLGNRLRERGEDKQAEQWYRRAIEAGTTGALNNLAILFGARGNHKQAEQYYLEAIDAGDVKAPFNLALMLEQEGELQRAEHYYLKAIEVGDIKALTNIGKVLFARGDLKRAEHYFREAIEAGDVIALFNLGVLLDSLGQREDARSFMQKAWKAGVVAALDYLLQFED